MKTFTKFLTMLAVAALFATGCVNEEPPYKEDPNPEPAGTTGYLSIGNLSMTVVYDETEIRPDDTSDETQAARIASGTRATAPDVDSFIVEILDADKGIKSFFVTIDSETLRPLLPVINLPEKFDICDIPDELVEVLHGEFGFPINEQVKNQTSVTFSITKFVEILLEIPGEHNFVLDVTDNDNVLTHKTVKLIVH